MVLESQTTGLRKIGPGDYKTPSENTVSSRTSQGSAAAISRYACAPDPPASPASGSSWGTAATSLQERTRLRRVPPPEKAAQWMRLRAPRGGGRAPRCRLEVGVFFNLCGCPGASHARRRTFVCFGPRPAPHTSPGDRFWKGMTARSPRLLIYGTILYHTLEYV